MHIKYSKQEVIELIEQKALEIGVYDITMEELVAYLPVSRRTLFRMFDSKEELLLEIYKRVALFLNAQVVARKAVINGNNRDEIIQQYIMEMLDVFITFERHTMFVVEFDALVKQNQEVIADYNEFYKQLNFVLYFLEQQYEDQTYAKSKLYQLSFLILETAYGIVYRYITTGRSNYQLRINEVTISELSYGLMSIVKLYENHD